MKLKNGLVILGISAAAAISLSACGSQKGGASSAEASKAESEAENETSAKDSAAQEAEAADTITKEALARSINDTLGLQEKSILYYEDIADAEYYDDIAKAVRAGYMDGDEDGSFHPKSTMSGADAAAVFEKLLPDGANLPLLDALKEKPLLTKTDAKEIISSIAESQQIIKEGLHVSGEGASYENTIIAGNVYVNPEVTELHLTNCVVLGNIYLDGASSKVDFQGRARVIEAKGALNLTLGKNTSVEYLYVWSGSNQIKTSEASEIGTLVAYGNTDISGKGTITLLRANADDIASEITPEAVTIGEMTKKMPVIAGTEYTASTSPKLSPDQDKIIETAKTHPSIKELPYDEGVAYHQDVYDKSHPFSSMYCSVGSVNLEDNQYIEKEFIMSGTANVYNLYDNDTPYIVKEDNPYATRLLVRYPDTAKGKKCSGRVYIDILNASSGIDLEDIWRRSYQHFMDSGDIYIGITSQSGTAEALKRFDAKRYQDINWKVNGKDEDGLVFDMLSQLGNLMRDDPHAILPAAMTPEYIYLTGQSWSGDYLNTYTSVFYDYYNRDRSLFDGYVSVVAPAETFIASDVYGPRDVYTETKEPYFVIMSESEHYFGSYGDWYLDFEYVRIPDASEENYKFRFYEVAGSSHSDPVSPILPNNPEIAKANNGTGRDPKQYDGSQKHSDLQLDMVITASLENVHNWAANGVKSPSGDQYWLEYRTVVDPFVKDMPEVVTDENHNALGGIRMPQMEAPIAQYKAFRNDSSVTDGSMIYFSSEKIKELYPGGYAEYKEQFNAAAKKLYEEGYLIESDYQKLIHSDDNKELFEN